MIYTYMTSSELCYYIIVSSPGHSQFLNWEWPGDEAIYIVPDNVLSSTSMYTVLLSVSLPLCSTGQGEWPRVQYVTLQGTVGILYPIEYSWRHMNIILEYGIYKTES